MRIISSGGAVGGFSGRRGFVLGNDIAGKATDDPSLQVKGRAPQAMGAGQKARSTKGAAGDAI